MRLYGLIHFHPSQSTLIIEPQVLLYLREPLSARSRAFSGFSLLGEEEQLLKATENSASHCRPEGTAAEDSHKEGMGLREAVCANPAPNSGTF